MRIKTALKKIVAPVLEFRGFQADFSHSRDSWFKTSDGVKWIEFDTSKYFPNKLRVFFCIENTLRLEMQYLKPDFFPISTMSYETQEELELYLCELAKELDEIILPYLDAMEKNYIPYTLDLNQSMSENTIARSIRFAEKWDLTIEPTRENMVKLDVILDSMRTDPMQRKTMFNQHREQIIDMGAYFGELLTRAYDMPGQWYWREVSGHSFYAVRPHGYDPMRRTIEAWNCGLEAFNYGFSKFPIPTSPSGSA